MKVNFTRERERNSRQISVVVHKKWLLLRIYNLYNLHNFVIIILLLMLEISIEFKRYSKKVRRKGEMIVSCTQRYISFVNTNIECGLSTITKI